MSSQTNPVLTATAEQLKDDTDRPPGSTHAHILPAPSGGQGDAVKYQTAPVTIQKTTIVSRPIAPAPVTATMTSHTLTRVTQAPPSVLASNPVVAAAPTSLISTSGVSLSLGVSSQSVSPMVSTSGLIQLSTSVPGTPVNSIIRAGTTISGGTGHLQFPSHLPKGAAAAVSALSGPKSGQTVATAILRPGAQGGTIQLPVSSAQGTLPQTYHPHLQPRAGAISGSLVGAVRPGTPPNPRTGSPVITAQLQQQLDHVQPQARVSMAQPLTTSNSLQITLQPQRTGLDPAAKIQKQRAQDPGIKAVPRMLVDTNPKIQPAKVDAVGKLQLTTQPSKVGDITTKLQVQTQPVKSEILGMQKVHVQPSVGIDRGVAPIKGTLQRPLADVVGKGQGQSNIQIQGYMTPQGIRPVTDPGGKIQIQRTTAGDMATKIHQQQRQIYDVTGKIISPKPMADMIGKIQLGTQRTIPDSTTPKVTTTTQRIPVDLQGKMQVQRTPGDALGKVQVQKTSLDLSNKVALDNSTKVQITRPALDALAGKPHVIRTPLDGSEKVQIQRVPREPPGKMIVQRPVGQEIVVGKSLGASLHAQVPKSLHIPASYTTTPLPSKVVLSQVPSATFPVTTHQQPHHQTTATKSIKSGMLPLSAVSSISSQLNSPLSTVTTSLPTSLPTSSIPIAKVTPQRQTRLCPLTTTTTTPGTVSLGTTAGSVSVTLPELSRPDLPPGGSVYISSVNRGSSGVASMTTTMALPQQQTHGDIRPDRSGVPHQLGQFIGSDYYTCNYGLQPGYSTMVYPSMTTSQALTQASLRPRLITSQTPNLPASLQASIQGPPGTVSRFPPTILQVDSSRQIYTSNPNTDGSLTPEKATVSSGLGAYTLSPAGPTISSTLQSQNTSGHTTNQSASPRPSILRKRASDGTPVKKPYCALNDNQIHSPRPESAPQSNTSSPKTPVTESRENSQSSTDTALSNEAAPLTSDVKVKQELPDSTDTPTQNNVEASPRKKPRKQLLNAVEELRDASSTDEEVERMSDMKSDHREPIKQEIREDYIDEEGVRWTVERTKPNIQLMNFYNRSWKARNNHFLKYQDVKPKDERRPTVNELSNSKSVLQKATGWRLYYMAAQLEDLTDLETEMCSRITDIQTSMSPEANSHTNEGHDDGNANRIHELTQATIQRCHLVNDQLSEARNSMLKILSHQKRILEIINKHMSKRPIKKKERS